MRKEAQSTSLTHPAELLTQNAQTGLTHMDMASQHHSPSPAWLTQKKLIDEAFPWNKIPSQFPRHSRRQQPPSPHLWVALPGASGRRPRISEKRLCPLGWAEGAEGKSLEAGPLSCGAALCQLVV